MSNLGTRCRACRQIRTAERDLVELQERAQGYADEVARLREQLQSSHERMLSLKAQANAMAVDRSNTERKLYEKIHELREDR